MENKSKNKINLVYYGLYIIFLGSILIYFIYIKMPWVYIICNIIIIIYFSIQNLKLYKLLINIDSFISYQDPKTTKQNFLKNLPLVTKLKLLKEPFKTNIIIEALDYIDQQRDILQNLANSFDKLYEQIEDNIAITLENNTTLLDYMLKEGIIEFNDIDVSKQQQLATINIFFNNIKVFSKKKKQQLEDIESCQNYLIRELGSFEKKKLHIVESLIEFKQTQQTLIIALLSTLYLSLIEIYLFITFQPKVVTLTSGFSGDFLVYIVKKGKNIKINADINMALAAGTSLDEKSIVMHGKPFKDLTILQKVDVASPFSSYLNDNITKERQVNKIKLKEVQVQKADLEKRAGDIKMQQGLQKNSRKLLISEDPAKSNTISQKQELKGIKKQISLLQTIEKDGLKKNKALNANLLPKKLKSQSGSEEVD